MRKEKYGSYHAVTLGYHPRAARPWKIGLADAASADTPASPITSLSPNELLRPRRFSALAQLLLLALPGCRSPELPRSVEASFGQFVASEAIYVMPNRDWSWTDSRWLFHHKSLLRVHAKESSRQPLHILLDPEPSTARYQLTPSWDGEPLPVLDPTEPGRPWRIEIAPERLTPGLHELRLERDYKVDASRMRKAKSQTEIRSIRVAHGDRQWAIEPTELPRYEYLQSFLTQGITGLDQTRFGGILLHRPGRWHQKLDADDALRFEATLENASKRRARFVASWAHGAPIEVRVPAGKTRRLVVPAPRRGGPLRIEITGDPDGFFLVGEPFVVRRSPPRRPTIVFVTLDTTRRDVVAPYSAEAATPNLSAFAETSTVFTRAYSTGPWTLPTHASMFTGLYPGQHGASIESRHLPYRWETLPELLRANGYFTAGLVGGFLCHSNFGLGQGMHHYRNPDAFETRGDRVTDSVERFLSDHLGRPLFLFVNYFDPHAPFEAPEAFTKRLGVSQAAEPLLDRPVWGPLIRGDNSQLKRAIQGEDPFDDTVRQYLRVAYEAEIAFMDAQVGRLFERLKSMGLWDDAMVIVVADHGELLGEDGHFTHSHRLDPELTAIPLMIKWPAQTTSHTIDGLVSQVDLFPTVLRAAGIPVPSAQHGRMLFPDRSSEQGRQAVFLEEHDTAYHPLFKELKVADHLYGIQSETRREILWEDQRRCFEQEGPGGLWRDVPCDEEPGLSLARLELLLAQPSERADTQAAGLSAEEEEALRALGYL